VMYGGCAAGVRMSVQNELLGDKPEGFCNRLNRDLISETALTFSHGNSKGEEPVREENWYKYFAWGGLIEPTVRFPCSPVILSFGPVHCCRSNHFPHSVSKKLNLSQCMAWLQASMSGCRAKRTWCQRKSKNQGQRVVMQHKTTSGLWIDKTQYPP